MQGGHLPTVQGGHLPTVQGGHPQEETLRAINTRFTVGGEYLPFLPKEALPRGLYRGFSPVFTVIPPVSLLVKVENWLEEAHNPHVNGHKRE